MKYTLLQTRLHSDPFIDSLQEASLKKQKKVNTFRQRHPAHQSDFVPSLPLSQYVVTQLKGLKRVDTVTTDPHKAGFCVYPSGALCYRNGSMRGFITLAAPEVYHGENDPSVGVYGIEGSKPGAAAASVFLSHKVRLILVYLDNLPNYQISLPNHFRRPLLCLIAFSEKQATIGS